MKKNIQYYETFLGLLYILYGILQVYNGVTNWWLQGEKQIQLGIKIFEVWVPNTFPDPFSGFTLITTGLLFLVAVYYSKQGFTKYIGYLFVAWLLAMIMLTLNIIEIIASFLDAYYPLLYSEKPNFEWNLSTDTWGIAPHFILGLLSSPLYFDLSNFIKELMLKQ